MSGSKHFDKIAWIATALCLAAAILFMNGGALKIEVKERVMGYEQRLFDNSRVHTIDLVMDDWDAFIASATTEEYHAASVIIDGEAYKNVGIRGKGNTSLSTVASMGSQRYSFKIEFDQYDSALSYHGLDKLSLNNLIQDTTMMKDYLTYTMMSAFGVNAPLCSFVYITVNGEDWGLYLAVEGVEEAFLQRNYGSAYGALYKPDSMSFGGGRGNGKDFDLGDFLNREDSGESGQGMTMPQMPGGRDFDPSKGQGDFGAEMPQRPDMADGARPSMPGGMGGMGMGSSDVKLQYIDDNAESYSNIWNNAKTDLTQADQARLMESLKKLSSGEEIESVVDIDQVIRYFVVHNYVLNGDSYTGSMIHNYYLYEEDGRMAMIPWDYNLAFGTFQGGDAQKTINTPIDSPISGGASDDRPMWNWIVANEEYTQLYHQYFAEFLDSVDVAGILNDAYALIKPYVQKDPTEFYSFEEFEAGVETMRQFCALRTQSIAAQLANGKTAETMEYVDASGLNLSDMGSMNKGGGMPNAPGDMESGSNKMPEGFDFDPTQWQGSGDGGPSAQSEMPKMPGGDFGFGMENKATAGASASGWIWTGASALTLLAGLIVAKAYRL